MSSLSQRVRALPRAARWGLAGAAVLGLFFGVIDPLLAKMQLWSGSDKALETALRSRAGDAERDKKWIDAVALGKRRFGDVLPPGDEQKRPLELGRAIDSILRKHGITEATKSAKSNSLPSGELSRALGAGKRVGLALQDLRFTATPEALAAVLADLEQQPEVSGVSRVQIDQTTGDDKAKRLLQVNLTVESLVVGAKEGK